MRQVVAVSLMGFFFCSALADGPKDNEVDSIRPIPPVGLELTGDQSQSLTAKCVAVRSKWKALVESYRAKTDTKNRFQQARHESRLAELLSLEPEIIVFPRAVEMAIELQQFFKPTEIDAATDLLEIGLTRIARAAEDPTWSHVVGLNDESERQLLVGGYRSMIDASFQPYAVVLPKGFRSGDSRPRRLDLWFHGRGETLSEVNFLDKGTRDAGQYTPPDTFVLHPYGRYCNAFKFAGEVDVLEALEYVSARLPVDPDRVSARGFSMGGAACWQFATHYSDRFFAANPGAGFSETPEFLKFFQSEDLAVTPDYHRTLWQLYDCPPWSRNLIQCPTVAYSGEIDRQKQAADVMEASLAEHGIDLIHVIGPQTAHKIHPDSKVEIERRMDQLARRATATAPKSIDFTTYTLRYPKMHWVEVHGMVKHWKESNVFAFRDDTTIRVQTENVTHLRLNFEAGEWNGAFPLRPTVSLDGVEFEGSAIRSDRSWQMDFSKSNGHWSRAGAEWTALRKRPGLQGPIDDAFMDSFLFVEPSGASADADVQRWTGLESEHAQHHWRTHFRGDVRRVIDTELTEQQIATSNLVLFGDPDSNVVLAQIAADLPVRWSDDRIAIGEQSFPRRGHAVAMIYPNPLNPDRYVVLNSGFTFREYDYLNNARQTPKLPDWAVFDVNDGANGRTPGTVKAAGFFDEQWQP